MARDAATFGATGTPTENQLRPPIQHAPVKAPLPKMEIMNI